MKQIWNKIVRKFAKLFKPPNKHDFLFQRIENLKKGKEEDRVFQFKIIGAKKQGFIVRIGGLLAYVGFQYMPWQYKSNDFWRAISMHLIGAKFLGRIHGISETNNPVSIIVNAKSHIFPPVKLIEYEEYDGVVIHKAKYGLFVDIGIHFKWKFGSLVGLIHKSNYKNEEELENVLPGGTISTFFHGYSPNDKIILGNLDLNRKWLTGELHEMIGTEQTAIVITNKYGTKEFFIDNTYKTSILIPKAKFPDSWKKVKRAVNALKDKEYVKCRIIKISRRRNFVSELTEINNYLIER